MADFAGTLQEIEVGSWRAGGTLVVSKPANTFDTVCKPRTFRNEAAAQSWLEGWAARHEAGTVTITVARLGEAPAA